MLGPARSVVVKSFRDLSVWQDAMHLAVRIYELTRTFPSSERYGLVVQLNRAIVSVPANIAEGHARSPTKEYMRFVSIERGSLAEVETYVMLAVRLEMIPSANAILGQTQQLSRMLRSLHDSLTRRLESMNT